jgi:hypothetical protein
MPTYSQGIVKRVVYTLYAYAAAIHARPATGHLAVGLAVRRCVPEYQFVVCFLIRMPISLQMIFFIKQKRVNLKI